MCIFAVCACDAQTGRDRPWMLKACICICVSVFLAKSDCLLLVSAYTFSEPLAFSEVCLWDPDRGWWGRCCEDPVRHLCQTLHLPGSPGRGPVTGLRWQVSQQPAGTSVGAVCVCVRVNYPKLYSCQNASRNEVYLTASPCNKQSGCRWWKIRLFHMHHQYRCYPLLFSQTT